MYHFIDLSENFGTAVLDYLQIFSLPADIIIEDLKTKNNDVYNALIHLSKYKFNNYFREFFYMGLIFVFFIIENFIKKDFQIAFLEELKMKEDKYKNTVDYFNFEKKNTFVGVVDQLSESNFEPKNLSSKDRDKVIRNWNREYIKLHPELVDKSGALIGSDIVVAIPEVFIQKEKELMIKKGIRADIIEKHIDDLRKVKRYIEEKELLKCFVKNIYPKSQFRPF